MSETLYVVTCISNPLRWQTRITLARAAVADWLREPNVKILLAECVYGSRDYDLADLASDRVTHIPLRATTMAWSKENLMNLAMTHLPGAAAKIATIDADVTFRRNGWATETLAALDLYPVIQPWDTAYDLGPHDEHIQTHKSFASLWHAGNPVVPTSDKFWTFNGGPYQYSHTGFAWGYARKSLDRIGGLFDVGGMGSADHHQAYALVGQHEKSLPGGVSAGYRTALAAWASRAVAEVNYKIGFVHGTIEHPFHGSKTRRYYQDRWGMFIRHNFDPATDLKRNTHGVVEFSGSKPDLEREWDNYLRSRREDDNSLD